MLRKLTLSGIRSYSEKNPQELEFMSPLTIILGSNGSGKTTIVEAIQYCLTGAFPPLSDNGKRFVREPEIEHDKSVKASIRLVATSTHNQTVTITRRFEVNVKDGKKAFKTHDTSVELDNDLIDEDSDSDDSADNSSKKRGNKSKSNAVSNRNRDLVDHIPKLLGIPPAIMQHVLFLHREESYWPLAEDKKVKEKFDVIFSSDKYSDALDQYRNHRKELVSTQKDEIHKFQLLAQHMQSYQVLLASVNQYQNETKTYAAVIEQCNEISTVIDKYLYEWNQIYSSTKIALAQIHSQFSLIIRSNQQLQQLKSQIVKPLYKGRTYTTQLSNSTLVSLIKTDVEDDSDQIVDYDYSFDPTHIINLPIYDGIRQSIQLSPQHYLYNFSRDYPDLIRDVEHIRALHKDVKEQLSLLDDSRSSFQANLTSATLSLERLENDVTIYLSDYSSNIDTQTKFLDDAFNTFITLVQSPKIQLHIDLSTIAPLPPPIIPSPNSTNSSDISTELFQLEQDLRHDPNLQQFISQTGAVLLEQDISQSVPNICNNFSILSNSYEILKNYLTHTHQQPQRESNDITQTILDFLIPFNTTSESLTTNPFISQVKSSLPTLIPFTHQELLTYITTLSIDPQTNIPSVIQTDVHKSNFKNLFPSTFLKDSHSFNHQQSVTILLIIITFFSQHAAIYNQLQLHSTEIQDKFTHIQTTFTNTDRKLQSFFEKLNLTKTAVSTQINVKVQDKVQIDAKLAQLQQGSTILAKFQQLLSTTRKSKLLTSLSQFKELFELKDDNLGSDITPLFSAVDTIFTPQITTLITQLISSSPIDFASFSGDFQLIFAFLCCDSSNSTIIPNISTRFTTLQQTFNQTLLQLQNQVQTESSQFSSLLHDYIDLLDQRKTFISQTIQFLTVWNDFSEELLSRLKTNATFFKQQVESKLNTLISDLSSFVSNNNASFSHMLPKVVNDQQIPLFQPTMDTILSFPISTLQSSIPHSQHNSFLSQLFTTQHRDFFPQGHVQCQFQFLDLLHSTNNASSPTLTLSSPNNNFHLVISDSTTSFNSNIIIKHPCDKLQSFLNIISTTIVNYHITLQSIRQSHNPYSKCYDYILKQSKETTNLYVLLDLLSNEVTLAKIKHLTQDNNDNNQQQSSQSTSLPSIIHTMAQTHSEVSLLGSEFAQFTNQITTTISSLEKQCTDSFAAYDLAQKQFNESNSSLTSKHVLDIIALFGSSSTTTTTSPSSSSTAQTITYTIAPNSSFLSDIPQSLADQQMIIHPHQLQSTLHQLNASITQLSNSTNYIQGQIDLLTQMIDSNNDSNCIVCAFNACSTHHNVPTAHLNSLQQQPQPQLTSTRLTSEQSNDIRAVLQYKRESLLHFQTHDSTSSSLTLPISGSQSISLTLSKLITFRDILTLPDVQGLFTSMFEAMNTLSTTKTLLTISLRQLSNLYMVNSIYITPVSTFFQTYNTFINNLSQQHQTLWPNYVRFFTDIIASTQQLETFRNSKLNEIILSLSQFCYIPGLLNNILPKPSHYVTLTTTASSNVTNDQINPILPLTNPVFQAEYDKVESTIATLCHSVAPLFVYSIPNDQQDEIAVLSYKTHSKQQDTTTHYVNQILSKTITTELKIAQTTQNEVQLALSTIMKFDINNNSAIPIQIVNVVPLSSKLDTIRELKSKNISITNQLQQISSNLTKLSQFTTIQQAFADMIRGQSDNISLENNYRSQLQSLDMQINTLQPYITAISQLEQSYSDFRDLLATVRSDSTSRFQLLISSSKSVLESYSSNIHNITNIAPALISIPQFQLFLTDSYSKHQQLTSQRQLLQEQSGANEFKKLSQDFSNIDMNLKYIESCLELGPQYYAMYMQYIDVFIATTLAAKHHLPRLIQTCADAGFSTESFIFDALPHNVHPNNQQPHQAQQQQQQCNPNHKRTPQVNQQPLDIFDYFEMLLPDDLYLPMFKRMTTRISIPSSSSNSSSTFKMDQTIIKQEISAFPDQDQHVSTLILPDEVRIQLLNTSNYPRTQVPLALYPLADNFNSLLLAIVAAFKDNLTAHQNSTAGKQGATIQSLSQAQDTLSRPPYNTVVKAYQTQQLKVNSILPKLIFDLDLFCKSLDRALSQYHELQLQTINAYISQFWNECYSSQDITDIFIKSDTAIRGNSDDDEQLAITTSKSKKPTTTKRTTRGRKKADSDDDIEEIPSISQPTTTTDKRKFTYRICGIQNGEEVDLRGRCSAGQRALICLLIRLALSMTVCSSWSSGSGSGSTGQSILLTLDEPTANLDAEHCTKFAQVLSKLIDGATHGGDDDDDDDDNGSDDGDHFNSSKPITSYGQAIQTKPRKYVKPKASVQFIIITHDSDFVNNLGTRGVCEYYYRVHKNKAGYSQIKKHSFNDEFM